MNAIRTFPILYSSRPPVGAPRSIPWSLVAGHADQAERNHNQTLERLAERGGLCPAEAVAVLEDRPWRRMDSDEAIARLNAFCSAFKAGRAEARHLEVIRMIALRYGPTITLEDCILLTGEVLAELEELQRVCGRPPIGLDSAMKRDPLAGFKQDATSLEVTQ